MQVKDLIVTGDAKILGNLYTKDGSVGAGGGGGSGEGGSGITYRLTKSGSTITLTGSDGSSSSVADSDTTTSVDLSGYVPTSRTVNGKALTGNISLSASDVGAAASSHTHDDRYFTESEINSKLSGYVPTSRTVNGKALTGNISLSASDVGAAASSHTHSYLPLAGGKLTGDLTLDSGSAGVRTLKMYYREGNNISIAHSLKSSFGGIQTAGALSSDYVLRNEKLSTSAENPSTNGTICWQYA